VRHSFFGLADLDLSLYRLDLENEIEFDPATFRFNNVGRSRHQGFDMSIAVRSGFGLQALVSYSLQDATLEAGEDSGNLIDLVPRHLGSVGLSYGGSQRWSGSLSFRFVGRQYLDSANTVSLQAYSTLAARVSYRAKSVELFLAGSNLLNNEYATSGFLTPLTVAVPGETTPVPEIMAFPAPERSWRAGLRWRFDSKP
jgi:Fe(3+) dicitrate transport protein